MKQYVDRFKTYLDSSSKENINVLSVVSTLVAIAATLEIEDNLEN